MRRRFSTVGGDIAAYHPFERAHETVFGPVGGDHRELVARAFVHAIHREVTVEARGTARRRARMSADPDRDRFGRHRKHATSGKAVELAVSFRVSVFPEVAHDA